MSTEVFRFTIRIERPADEVFAWHCRPGAFARLQPPWERVSLPGGHPGVREGARVTVRSWIGPVPSDWVVEHCDVEPGRQFRDVMLRGPFASWTHTHRFEPDGDNACRLGDVIECRLPLGSLGKMAAGGWVGRKLRRMFAYRHAVTKADLEAALPALAPRRILISGASGLIGSALVPFLQTQGHTVLRLVRRTPRDPSEIFWQPETGVLDPRSLEGLDAVVHLAGANIAAGRWTPTRRAAIRESRLLATRTLLRALGGLSSRPSVLVSASATGWYGHRGNEELDEQSGSRPGFLAEVCQDWENEVARAGDLGLRPVILRFGVVLTPAGGALARMLPAFKAGVAGRLGDGRQWFSWIAPDDVLAVITQALSRPAWSGVYNTVAPQLVRNAEFTATLARVLHRPALLPVPAGLLRLLFGRMADETLLASARVRPRRLLDAGFRFRHPALEAALRHVLGR